MLLLDKTEPKRRTFGRSKSRNFHFLKQALVTPTKALLILNYRQLFPSSHMTYTKFLTSICILKLRNFLMRIAFPEELFANALLFSPLL